MYVCLSTLEFVMSQNGWHKDDGKPVGKKPRILDVAIALQWYYCRYLWWAGVVGQNTSLHYHHWHHHQRPPLLMSKRFLQKKTKNVSDVDKQIHTIELSDIWDFEGNIIQFQFWAIWIIFMNVSNYCFFESLIKIGTCTYIGNICLWQAGPKIYLHGKSLTNFLGYRISVSLS